MMEASTFDEGLTTPTSWRAVRRTATSARSSCSRTTVCASGTSISHRASECRSTATRRRTSSSRRAGRAISRFPDGDAMTLDYEAGDTWFDEVANGDEVHDLENVGSTRLRFTTVELLA